MKKFTKAVYLIAGVLIAVLFITSAIFFLMAKDVELKNNCLFACGQAALFMLVNFVPLIMKKLKLYVPDFVYLIFLIFCLAHFLLGEIFGFFALVPWWDSMLHTVSGVLITFLAFSFIKLLNGEKGDLSLACTIIAAFCVTVTVGVVWEIVEFAMDGWFGLNMQRAYLSNASGERGAALIGSDALSDTMKDLILDALGALIVCVVAAIVCITKKKDINNLVLIKRVENANEINQTENK